MNSGLTICASCYEHAHQRKPIKDKVLEKYQHLKNNFDIKDKTLWLTYSQASLLEHTAIYSLHVSGTCLKLYMLPTIRINLVQQNNSDDH